MREDYHSIVLNEQQCIAGQTTIKKNYTPADSDNGLKAGADAAIAEADIEVPIHVLLLLLPEGDILTKRWEKLSCGGDSTPDASREREQLRTCACHIPASLTLLSHN